MNGTIFWRMVWKEYRSLRALWLILSAVSVALIGLIASIRVGPPLAAQDLWTVAAVLAACYSVTCAAILFAAEKGDRTDELLKSLPLSPALLITSKLGLGIVSSGALLLVGTLAASGFGQVRLYRVHQSDYSYYAQFPLMMFELFAWGLFFSLLTKQVMNALCFSAAAFVAALFITGMHAARWTFPVGPENELWITIRVVFAVLLFALDIVMARHWYLGRRILFARPSVVGVVLFIAVGSILATLSIRSLVAAVAIGLLCFLLASPVLAWLWIRRSRALRSVTIPVESLRPSVGSVETVTARETGSVALRQMKRLIWLEWRQARLALMIVPAAIGICLLLVAANLLEARPPQIVGPGISLFGAVLAPFICGLFVFRGEQHDKRYRIPGERGISPTRLWLSKQLVWIPMALLWMFCFGVISLVAVVAGPHSQSFRSGLSRPLEFQYILSGVVFLASIYAVGQLTSMLLHRVTTAAAVGLALVLLVWLRWWLLATLDVPLIWSMTPIPLILLGVSWFRCGDWTCERNTLRAWLSVIAVLLMPMSVLFAAVSTYRVAEVAFVLPATWRDLLPDEEQLRQLEPPPQEALQTAALYRKACELDELDLISRGQVEGETGGQPTFLAAPVQSELQHPELREADPGLLERNEQILALVRKASRRKQCAFVDPRDPGSYDSRLVVRLGSLGRQLRDSARKLTEQGRLDEAWSLYRDLLGMTQHISAYPPPLWHEPGFAFRQYLLDDLPEWANHPQQTSERIKTDVLEMQRLEAERPSISERIMLQYLVRRRMIEELDQRLLQASMASQDANYAAGIVLRLGRWFPWERKRALLVLEASTVRELLLAYAIEKQLNVDEPVRFPVWHFEPGTIIVVKNQAMPQSGIELPKSSERRGVVGMTANDQIQRWMRTTAFLPAFYGSHKTASSRTVEFNLDLTSVNLVDRVATMRALSLVMAIVSWRKEHGELPESLEQLQGSYFEKLPLDPWTGQSFLYFREGVNGESQVAKLGVFIARNHFLFMNKPFLMSQGAVVEDLRDPPFGISPALRKLVFRIPAAK